MPSTATKVTAAASQPSCPRRLATKSAIEVLLLSRTSRTSRISRPMPNTYSSMVPTKVGGSGQP